MTVKVMVVDDHPMWRDAVARDLEEAGFDIVATAGDGPEAVRRARAAAPQVLVLDLNLPGLSGVQVCKAVIGDNPALRVLVLSASGEHECRKRDGIAVAHLAVCRRSRHINELVAGANDGDSRTPEYAHRGLAGESQECQLPWI